MTLFHIAGAQQFVYEYMKSKGVDVTSVPWLPHRLYVMAPSPSEVRNNLPVSHRTATKEITLLPPEEAPSLASFKARQTLPARVWVRIKKGLYKGDIAFVERSNASEAVVVVAPRIRPYDLPQQKGEKDLFSSELATLAGLSLVPISSATGVDIGFTCGDQDFVYGLLRLSLPVDFLTLIELPHPDDISFHVMANFEQPTVEETIHLFSAQFWRECDIVEIRGGDLHGVRGSLVDVEWHKRTASLLPHTVKVQKGGDDDKSGVIHCSIPELRRVFRAGDAVKVTAGPRRGYTGHVIAAYGGKVTLQHDGQSLNVSLHCFCSYSTNTVPSSRFLSYFWNHGYQIMCLLASLDAKKPT